MAKMPIAHLASEVPVVVVLSRSWGGPAELRFAKSLGGPSHSKCA
jgi:hypothetical protein